MMPPEIEALAMNLWWSWDTDATALWREIDAFRWERSLHNPVALLRDVEPARWAELANDHGFLARLADIWQRFQAYLAAPTWCATALPDVAAGGIAYLCMEFGLHESLRIYAGGLGVLAGDHVRSASDLGVPLTGVGLLYRGGYFIQVVDDHRQLAAYPVADFDRMPLTQIKDDCGLPLELHVPLGDEGVRVRVWSLAVGRTRVLLLDTDFAENPPAHRAITATLYGGDHRTRMHQEIVLGIGGIRALRALGMHPAVVHLNEGHCAFAVLELAREVREREGTTWAASIARAREQVVFTTHTPVPAGHDRFTWPDMHETLGPWRDRLGLPRGSFMDLGRVRPTDLDEPMCMTVLALRGSTFANGVSALHGRVSREMWAGMWPTKPVDEVPIGHVTNGVHPIFWASPEARALYDTYIPGWREHAWDEELWAAGVAAIPDAALWELRRTLRGRLVAAVRERIGFDLDPDALTIGFARRFAPYKRGGLFFRDPERARAILAQGVQLVYAGKAHPADKAGQEIIHDVLSRASKADLRGRVAFLPDYSIETGRLITAGSDVWLNNPRRPQEASGTSGQKVPLNGGINLSILDGWWAEGFDGLNGWAISDGVEGLSDDEHDQRDVEALYQLLEDVVIPTWKQRDADGLPHRWLTQLRRSIATCAPRFNSHRMVRDYAVDAYGPICAAARRAG
jgi:starch phosphorylase